MSGGLYSASGKSDFVASAWGAKDMKSTSKRLRTPIDRARKPRRGAGGQRITSRIRMPIALKFAGFIALLVVTLMIWQAHTAIRLAGDRLEMAINDSGIGFVTSIAILIDPRWLTELDFQDDIEKVLEKFKASHGTDKVQDIRFYNSRRELIADFRGNRSVSKGKPVDYLPAADAEVDIKQITAAGVPVLSFSKKIYGEQRTTGRVMLGQIDVFLSARQISDTRESLSRELALFAFAGCLGAAIASFFLARFLTRSIRTLVRDMRRVSQGDLEHKTNVDSGDELGDLGRTFNLMTSNLQEGQEAKLAQKATEHELSLATGIQSRLLPSELPQIAGLDVAVYYLSAKEVGGDYYDFIPIDSDHLGIVVADVSGKGVPGSLVMTMTRSLMRMAAAKQLSPTETVSNVNRCLVPDIDTGMFVTLLYLVIDVTSKEFSLVRAGHNAPLLYSGRHRKLLQLHPRGIAVGLDREGTLFESELEVKRLRLHPGDVFLAYTDGVVEGKDINGEVFGEDRLNRILVKNHAHPAQPIVDAVITELNDHQSGIDRSDDITLLVIRCD